MAFNLKQWRDQQQESEDEQPSAKIPRQLLLESPQHHHQQQEAAALPLFVSAESQPNKISTHLSAAYPDHSSTPTAIPTSTARFPRVGGGYCFSIAQWQELELQAVIFRHMMAGATVPHELLQLVKKSLLASSASPYYLHHYPAHFQQAALLQAGYWGKGAMDPEPGRCRRTDGKKWRCSRDVVAGHKYCERHMHRGRNRSRKPVEFPASVGAASGGGLSGGGLGGGGGGGGGGDLVGSVNRSSATFAAGSIGGIGGGGGGGGGGGTQFSLSGPGAASLDAFQLNQGSSELRSDNKRSLFEIQHDSLQSGDDKSNNNKVLMHFFDDWPRRSLQDNSDNAETNGNGNSSVSATSLSISTNAATTTNSSSDFLRLSTGNGDELGRRGGNGSEERESAQLSWSGSRWGANPVASMGGPLAEALRSSTNSSPTSVLHQLPRCSASDPSFVSV